MSYDFAQALAIDALWTLTGVCAQLRDDQLAQPTPCAGWDVNTLLEHMTGQHHGVAAALSGSGGDLADWRPLPVGEDRAWLLKSIDEVRLALLAEPAEAGWMPEIQPAAPLPTAMVLRAHLVDTIAHGWDVAAAMGVSVEFSPPVLATAYAVASQIADGPERDQPRAAFAHTLPGAAEPTLAGFLALLGRDIAWAPRS